jgi:DNA-binding PadR family transcriptional regulator
MSRKTDFAILGILTHGPQTGYDIKKHISNSIGYFWQESYGQLYPTLKSLVKRGFAVMHTEATEGKPDRKVYQITEPGLIEFRKWLLIPIENLPKLRNEFLLKLFFGKQVPVEINISHLQRYKEYCQSYLEDLENVRLIIEEQAGQSDKVYWLITVSNGHHLLKAAIEWCNESIQILKKGL